MGHESQIELWSPNLTTFCFVGFGTDRLRREEVMKTAGRENPNHGVAGPRNRAHGAVGQNRSCSIKWAAKQEKFRPTGKCFFLTSPFIELGRQNPHSSLGFALEPKSLCLGQEKRTMRESEHPIENSRWNAGSIETCADPQSGHGV